MNPDSAVVRLSEEEIGGYLEFACHLAQLAGEAILPHFRAVIEVENKAGPDRYDPVTIADRAAEDAIRSEIKRVYPDHAIYGEELGRTAGHSSPTAL